MPVTNRLPPVHPGEILREEMDERDLSANSLAQALDIPANRITAILNGQRGVTAETAHRLSRYFGTTAELWLNLQKTWELRRAEIEAEEGERVSFVPTTGSLVGGRHKDKKERISEALSDLHLVIGGFATQGTGQHERRDLPQRLGALARMCSVFLRKLALGDRGDRKTRLLDDAVMESLQFRFQPLRKIPRGQRRTIRTGFGGGGGFMEVTKLDEPGPGAAPTYRFPVVPHDLEFAVEWPLPGAADWTGVPSGKDPWLLSAGQLFETDSKRTLGCDEWLGQQVVLFDGRPISLKDIFRTVVTYEGAHAINVARLAEIDGHKPFKPATEPALHLLNNIMLFGIRFAHVIVIESALYLYERLLDEPSIQRPEGGLYMLKPGFACAADQAGSSRPDWLRFEGTMMMSFSSKPKSTRHTIRPVG